MTSGASLKWQSDYTRLNNADRAIIDKHLAFSDKLDKWDETRAHLIDEFHHKKFSVNKRSFKAKDEETGAVYTRFFLGRTKISSFDVFPCTFQSELEELLFKEIGHRSNEPINLISIYYGSEKERVRKTQLDKSEWVLDECDALSENDKEVLNRFREGFLALFDEVIELLHRERMECNMIEMERKRVLKHLVPL